MKMYVETDNRLIKEDSQKKDDKKSKNQTEDTKKSIDILESYGLSKNAQILTE